MRGLKKDGPTETVAHRRVLQINASNPESRTRGLVYISVQSNELLFPTQRIDFEFQRNS